MEAGTKYSSDTNGAWLGRDELLRMISEWEAGSAEGQPRRRRSDLAEPGA
jgi:hypothetical protein